MMHGDISKIISIHGFVILLIPNTNWFLEFDIVLSSTKYKSTFKSNHDCINAFSIQCDFHIEFPNKKIIVVKNYNSKFFSSFHEFQEYLNQVNRID